MNNILKGGVDFSCDIDDVVVVVAVVSMGGSHHPLLGGTRSTTRMKIFFVVNETTKDISKLVSTLFSIFIFLPVLRINLLEKRYNGRCIKCIQPCRSFFFFFFIHLLI